MSHHVPEDRQEAPFEEDAELRESAGGKGVAFAQTGSGSLVKVPTGAAGKTQQPGNSAASEGAVVGGGPWSNTSKEVTGVHPLLEPIGWLLLGDVDLYRQNWARCSEKVRV